MPNLIEFSAAGPVDEIGIHLAPVLLGSGIRCLSTATVTSKLELADVVATPVAVLRFRVDS